MGMLVRPCAAALTTVLLAALLVLAGGSLAPAEAAAKPAPPRAVTASPADRAARVSWSAPARTGGGRIGRYAVQRRTSPSGAWATVRTLPGSARSWTATALTNGVRYGFRVRAHGRTGWSRWSAETTTTPRGVPGEVRYVEADVHKEALGVYWQPPATANGAPIDSYRVEVSTGDAVWTSRIDRTTVATSAAPVLVTGLTPGTRYWVRVRAHNAAGFGEGGKAGPYRALTAPAPVTNLVATAGDAQVALTWTEPAVANGVPAATGYRVEASTDDGTTWAGLATPSTPAYLATGLTNGTTYRFRVSARASNGRLGYGAPTLASPARPAGAPGVPGDLGLGWDPLAATHRLTWAAPAADGGHPVTHYLVQQGALPEQRVDAPATALDAGVAAPADAFRVRACSDLGCGPWSADVGPVPGQVGDLSAEAARAGASYTVTLGWSAPAGTAPSSYLVERSTDGTTFTEVGSTAGTTFADPAAVPATTYAYRVVARSATGHGRPAATEVTTGPLYDLAVAPSAVVVDEGGSAVVAVSLDRPAAADTVVQVGSDRPAAAAPAGTTVTIPAGQQSADVTVAGLADDDLADEDAVLTFALPAQTRTVQVTVLDDDQQAIVASASELSVANHGEATFGVRLAFRPAGDVTVTVESDAPNKVGAGPATLTFTPQDWDVAQTVTVTGESPGGATVAVASAGLATHSVGVTVTSP